MPTLSNNELTLTIRAIDEATATLKKVRDNVDGVSDSSERNTGIIAKLRANWAPIAAVTAAAGVAFSGTMQAMDTTITAANNLQGALTGLSSVARAFGADQNRANQAARRLASDGLMSVTESATGLKNLLASGFSLDQAITLMERFKDSAAFNRQAALGFGQAVASATEGIKNGNSILVDNAGVTKNLSIILKEMGYAETDVMRASSDAGVRQALFNGILKETNAQVGDAAKLANLYAGEQSKVGAATLTLQQNIGTAIQSALLPFLKAVTPIITAVSNWVQQNQQLAAAIAIGVTLFLGLAAAVGAVAGIIALVGSVAALAFGGIIALVAAVAAALIVYWKPISGFFVNLWNGIAQTTVSIWNGVVGWFVDVIGSITDAWNGIVSFFAGVWNGIVSTVSDVFNGVRAVFTAVIDWIREWGTTVLAVIFWPFSLALGLIIANWSTIAAFFTQVWRSITTVFSPVVAFFGTVFGAAWQAIAAVWNFVVGYYAAIWNAIVGIFSVAANFFGSVFAAAWGAITAVFSAVGGWFGARFGEAVNAIKVVFGGIIGWFGGIWNSILSMFGRVGGQVGDAIGGAFKQALNFALGIAEGAINGFIKLINAAIDIINKIPSVHIPKISEVKFPRFARGTNYAPGGLALVGEEGPELVNLPRGSQVKTASETRQALSQAQSGPQLNVTQNIYNQVDYDRSWAEISWRLRTA